MWRGGRSRRGANWRVGGATAGPSVPASPWLCNDVGMSDRKVRASGEADGEVDAPEFPLGLDWINTETPLTLLELRGKIVLLDFWTYCCINCMHAIEDIKRLEEKYAEELVVVGVHSGKFDTEADIEGILEAVDRWGIRHPVVNDSNYEVWKRYGMRGWPGFVLISPRGKVVGGHYGENVYRLFDRVLAQLVKVYETNGEIRRSRSPCSSGTRRASEGVLRYPGKVLADPVGGRLFVADTNHHRIVISGLDGGEIFDVAGCGESGLIDGIAEVARFSHPQGMAVTGDSLYVADTGNHAVRRVDLETCSVATVAGDGHQDHERNSAPGPIAGRRLNSPWDIESVHGVLFVAMAGSHQIFGIDATGDFIAGHAGSGEEDHVDGPLLAAALAQPSGLTTDGESLFVADSEVSSVRSVSLDPRGGHVRTVVGKGLFDFGDVDGVGDRVRLQHPMGVAYADGTLYVADTFNHKVKAIELSTRRVTTLAGNGRRGLEDGRGPRARFHEPSGLSVCGSKLYVADTNNHAIRVIERATGHVSTLAFTERSGPGRRFA